MTFGITHLAAIQLYRPRGTATTGHIGAKPDGDTVDGNFSGQRHLGVGAALRSFRITCLFLHDAAIRYLARLCAVADQKLARRRQYILRLGPHRAKGNHMTSVPLSQKMRRWKLGLKTLFGASKAGYFIPYRYAAETAKASGDRPIRRSRP